MRDDYDAVLSQSVEIGTLCAYYGKLLTVHQLKALRMHYEEDLSLAEIAEVLQVSRQNVHDMLVRSVQKLRSYETALGFVAHEQRLQTKLHDALAALQQLDAQHTDSETDKAINQARQTILDALRETESANDESGGSETLVWPLKD